MSWNCPKCGQVAASFLVETTPPPASQSTTPGEGSGEPVSNPDKLPPASQSASMVPNLPGNWPEDASHENGDYEGKCAICGSTFYGHKRRVTCKVCASQSATPSDASTNLDGIGSKSVDGPSDTERLDYIERTFSGMTNRERYLPVQMIWGKGANGRTLREACDKYMKRDAGGAP